jgi:hypothetical protein
MTAYLLLALGALLLAAAIGVWRGLRVRFLRPAITGGLLVLAILALVVGGVLFWYTHRPVPSDTQRVLFEGITYTRDVRDDPRPLIIHVVTVDLDAPGVTFLVTPGEPTGDHQLAARTTSEFLDEFDLQVAINGSYFYPFWTNSPWDYYPHSGDPVSVYGFASAQGVAYSEDDQEHVTLYLSEDNRAGFFTPQGPVYNAVSGNHLILQAGLIRTQDFTNAYHTDLHPRTAVALDEPGETLILVVVDGRQPNYSEGVSLAELAAIILDYGGYAALNLDGGGSSTLVVDDGTGKPDVLNSPIDNRIPGRERPVANHLGIWAQPPGN